MDARARIQALMQERNWTAYRLAIMSGLSQSSIANILSRNTTPSIVTLEAIFQGLGITLSQFFADSHMVEMTDEQYEMFLTWSTLSKEQKAALQHLIRVMKSSES